MKGFFKRWLAGAALWALVIGIVSVVMLVVVFWNQRVGGAD